MYKVKAIVEFTFVCEGDPGKAQESIRQQIQTDVNEYYQYPYDNAEFESLKFSWIIPSEEK